MPLPRYYTIAKNVGETPLNALERLRVREKLPKEISLAYAGRLDPMASGELLILVGEECKHQDHYHTLDKEYQFEVLLGVGSDTHDVLGIVTKGTPIHPSSSEVKEVLTSLMGTITLPYPHFSSKTVKGKPLHTWTLEGRLDEIVIPKKTSTIYSLSLTGIRTLGATDIHREVIQKIASLPSVTDPKKALGEDFRRVDVRASWDTVHNDSSDTEYTILSLTCICSTGTYMRTLASVIGERFGTKALAYAIHRTRIGKYYQIPLIGGFFSRSLGH